MAQENSRLRRVADQIHRELAELIRREVKDPRVGMVTITSVEVTHEFERADVFLTVLNSDERATKESIKALNHAAGFLRREIGKRLRLRHVPELKFKYDASVETGVRLTALINAARAADEQRSGESEDES